jgi:transposase
MSDKKTAVSSIATLPAARRSEDERSEAERSGAAGNVVAESTTRPEPEVVAKATRRRFTGAYKQRILLEADAAKATGTFGAMLRRERLYSSLLVNWRRERDAGILKGLTPAKRGPKSRQNPLDAEVGKLRSQNARLTEDLRKAGIIIDVQKKLATLLETLASQEETAGKHA